MPSRQQASRSPLPRAEADQPQVFLVAAALQHRCDRDLESRERTLQERAVYQKNTDNNRGFKEMPTGAVLSVQIFDLVNLLL